MTPRKRDLTALVGKTDLADLGAAPTPAADVPPPARSAPPSSSAPDAAERASAASSAPAAEVEQYPVRLPRDEPLIALNVKVRWGFRHGLPLLAAAKGTTIQDEIDAALAAHFARAKFVPPDFFRGQPG